MQHKTRKKNNTTKNNTAKNKTTKNKKFKNLKCSPNKENKFTCYSNNSLTKIKKLWNLRHPDHKILTNNTKDIWVSLKDNMKHICSNEKCWLNQHFIKNNLDKQLKKYTFAPKSPSSWKNNPNEWLTSLDIEAVMKQYENYYKCFEFLGPSPIDYDTHVLYGECVWEELCNLNISEQIKRNINKIGIILNTDPHNKDGEHWISLFVNIKKKFIVYFDSNGNKPPKQVTKLMNEIKNQGKQLGIDFKLYNNEIEHQKSESECGMYCLYFIIEMLKDKDIEYFLDNKIDDKEVFVLRNKYFNPSEVN